MFSHALPRLYAPLINVYSAFNSSNYNKCHVNVWCTKNAQTNISLMTDENYFQRCEIKTKLQTKHNTNNSIEMKRVSASKRMCWALTAQESTTVKHCILHSFHYWHARCVGNLDERKNQRETTHTQTRHVIHSHNSNIRDVIKNDGLVIQVLFLTVL